MKLFILIVSTFVITSFVYSQTYYMNVNLQDGTKVTYEVANISKIDFSGITGLEDAKKLQNIVKSFKLLQNYPNPFNPSTTIKYEIPESGNVAINIYDISGRLIKKIVNKNQQAGFHKILWDGQTESGIKAASGFYIYKVKFGQTIASKKMILLK